MPRLSPAINKALVTSFPLTAEFYYMGGWSHFPENFSSCSSNDWPNSMGYIELYGFCRLDYGGRQGPCVNVKIVYSLFCEPYMTEDVDHPVHRYLQLNLYQSNSKD